MNQPRSRKQSLRRAFIATVATAGAIAAGGCFTNDATFADCPAAQPATGDGCTDDGATCNYGSDGCGNEVTFGCDGSTWSPELTAVACNPPPPVECPMDLPINNDPCPEVGLTCDYPDGIGSSLSARCSDTGWEVDEPIGNPPPPTQCPIDVPFAGMGCGEQSLPAICGYLVETPCGTEPVVFDCQVAQLSQLLEWVITTAPTCDTRPEQCQSYGDSAFCEADPGCSWRVPGCAESSGVPAVTAGCYPTADCATIQCGAWGTCTEVDVDPCWNSSCDACSQRANVCIPNPAT